MLKAAVTLSLERWNLDVEFRSEARVLGVFGASGAFLNAAAYVADGQATSNGDGTGTLTMDYSLAGVSTSVTENFTYSIDASCHLTAHASLAGIPATFAGNITHSGNLMYFTTTLTGTSIHGRADKDQ